MRCAGMDHVFIAPDVICGVVKTQDVVFIDSSALEHDCSPVDGRVVFVTFDRMEIWAYE
jgi:hypothetical protein